MKILLSFLKFLKLPIKIIVNLVKGERKKNKKSELEQKQLAYVRNFATGRLKNTSWQKSLGKEKKIKKPKKSKKKTKKII
ncbi:MAG: hypothetical protein LBR43_03090 [Spiroplasmataceae bacterium]|nr:hypothetical protein [Spiroplasmataceae bacterium]